VVPLILAAILFLAVVGLLVVTLARGSGDIPRWAAVSTIWIAIPVMIASLIFLAVLIGINYLLMRLLGITPTYTKIAQDFVEMLGLRIQRVADASVRPFMFWDSIGASLKRLFGGK
jgi:hypothetical protein